VWLVRLVSVKARRIKPNGHRQRKRQTPFISQENA
jgi:hypothetical protein